MIIKATMVLHYVIASGTEGKLIYSQLLTLKLIAEILRTFRNDTQLPWVVDSSKRSCEI